MGCDLVSESLGWGQSSQFGRGVNWPYWLSRGSDMSAGGGTGMAISPQGGNHLSSWVCVQSLEVGAMVATIEASLIVSTVRSRHWRAAALIQAATHYCSKRRQDWAIGFQLAKKESGRYIHPRSVKTRQSRLLEGFLSPYLRLELVGKEPT
jgi:hypothetical protein